ncbi:MAG: hypothetical protein PHI29_06310 [Gallionella sp.]|nr:hypothetical protein [Gallionella sp.]
MSVFRLHHKSYFPKLFVGLLAFWIAMFWLYPTKLAPELFLSVTGAIAAFVHFLYTQHNHSTERFISLFGGFNARYDQLNCKLNSILLRENALLLTQGDKQTLYDYFNLCAEEYLYYKAGYIDGEVWKSWLQGMKHFCSDDEIRRLWQDELKSDSYYGFSISFLDTAA